MGDGRLSLATWQTIRRELLWAYAAPVPTTANRFHPFNHSGAWLVLKGSAEIDVDSSVFRAKAGEWLVPPPIGVRRQRFGRGTELLSVRFVFTWPDARPVYADGLPLMLPETAAANLRKTGLRLAELWQRASPGPPTRSGDIALPVWRQAQLESAFARFVSAWSRTLERAGVGRTPARPLDQRVQAALSLLEHDDLSAPQLASRLSLSVSQVNRIFLRSTGMTPSMFRDQRRLAAVCEQLQRTDDPIKAIAYRNGFKRLSHFSAWFSRSAGVSPRAYRSRSAVV